MTPKTINTITNIVGVPTFIGSIVFYFMSKIDTTQFIVLLVLGLILMGFKWRETKKYIDRILNKKIDG